MLDHMPQRNFGNLASKDKSEAEGKDSEVCVCVVEFCCLDAAWDFFGGNYRLGHALLGAEHVGAGRGTGKWG